MRIGPPDHTYDWQEHWPQGDGNTASDGWAHHGVVVTSAGQVVSFHPDAPRVVIRDRTGEVIRSWESGLLEGHGITLVRDGEEEFLWIADCGNKMRRAEDGSYQPEVAADGGAVQKYGLDGEVVQRLDRPGLPAYLDGPYAPTWVAVNESRFGGDGHIWVADGYGQSYVHRYDAFGAYLSSLSGEEGGGRFDCPHAVYVDHRRGEPELYVADRGNARIQVYGCDGSFRRVVGEGVLNSPSGMVAHGELLVVGELYARLALLDLDDQLIGYLGDNGEVCSVQGWPNEVLEAGGPVQRPALRVGKFNSPHGLAVDADGNLYVAEWLVGGRLTKLTPAL